MSKEYIEQFFLSEYLDQYYISKNEECGKVSYKPWAGGSAIDPGFHTIQEARKYIFDHVNEAIHRRLARMNVRIAKLGKIYTTLDNDVSNLAKFKIIH